MNLYGANDSKSIEDIANSDSLMEMFFVDEMMHSPSDEISEFCESAEAQVLVEKAVLNKPTLIRLSKTDDQKRRVKIVAYQLAKEANDPEWNKMKKYTALRKQSIRKIMRKYGKKAQRIAKVAQKNYIIKSKSMKPTKSEMKAQSAR
jgi:hypothetical protein